MTLCFDEKKMRPDTFPLPDPQRENKQVASVNGQFYNMKMTFIDNTECICIE